MHTLGSKMLEKHMGTFCLKPTTLTTLTTVFENIFLGVGSVFLEVGECPQGGRRMEFE